jgi:hypothetical protein
MDIAYRDKKVVGVCAFSCAMAITPLAYVYIASQYIPLISRHDSTCTYVDRLKCCVCWSEGNACKASRCFVFR